MRHTKEIIIFVICFAVLMCFVIYVTIEDSNKKSKELIRSQDELIQVQNDLIVDYEDIIIMQGVLLKNK